MELGGALPPIRVSPHQAGDFLFGLFPSETMARYMARIAERHLPAAEQQRVIVGGIADESFRHGNPPHGLRNSRQFRARGDLVALMRLIDAAQRRYEPRPE